MANGITAWLVTWEAVGEAAETADIIASIIGIRTSQRVVAALVELLYAQRFCTATELASYARNRSNNPYPARHDPNGGVSCGHNPFLYARKVTKLLVSTDASTGLETITWVEPNRYRLSEDGSKRETVSVGAACKVTRIVTEGLSAEQVWDRARGARQAQFPK